MADLNARAMRKTFIHHGFIVKSDPTTKYVEESGRADLTVVGNGHGVMVEVKFAWGSFDFDNWRENQREWADTYCENAPFNTEYWLALTIPTYKPIKSLSSRKPALSWLIPKKKFLEVEHEIRKHQKSIPAVATKDHMRVMRDFGLDAKQQFRGYQLDWSPAGTLNKPPWYKPDEEHKRYNECMWTLPTIHPFYVKYCMG